MSSSGRRREGCFHNRRPRKKPAHPAKPKFPLTDEHIRAMCPEGDGIYTDEDSIRSERKSRTDSASSLGSVVMEELNSCASGFGSGNEVYRQTNPATTPHNVCAPHLRSCTKRITRRQFTGMGEARFKSVSPSNAAFCHPLVHSRPQVVVQPKKERDFYSDASDPQAWYAIIRTMNPGDSDLFVPEYLLSYLPNVKELFHPGRDNYFNHCVDHTVFLKILRIIDNDYNKSPHDNHSDVLLYKMYEYAVKLECSFIINFVTSELKNRGHYTTEELLDLYKFASRWEIEELLEECKTRLGKLRTAEALDVAMRLGLQDVKMAILRAMPIKALNDYFTTKLGFTEVDNEIVAKKYTRRPRPQFSRTSKFAENPQVIWPAIRT